VSTTVSSLYLAVRAREIFVPSWLWWGAPLGGTLLAVFASLPAAWEAANTSPRAAMQRATLHHTTTRFAWPLAAGGLFTLLIAFALCHPSISGRTVFAGFVASFFTLGGFALLTPILTLWGGALAQRVGGAIVGITGTMAGSYLQRALNRSSLVIAALMVSLAMAIGMSLMVLSFRYTVADWVDTTISADLYIAPATGFSGDLGPGLPADVVQYARALPNLRSIDTIRNIKTQIGKQAGSYRGQ
jgi:putative ABC transport system permease protein